MKQITAQQTTESKMTDVTTGMRVRVSNHTGSSYVGTMLRWQGPPDPAGPYGGAVMMDASDLIIWLHDPRLARELKLPKDDAALRSHRHWAAVAWLGADCGVTTEVALWNMQMNLAREINQMPTTQTKRTGP